MWNCFVGLFLLKFNECLFDEPYDFDLYDNDVNMNVIIIVVLCSLYNYSSGCNRMYIGLEDETWLEAIWFGRESQFYADFCQTKPNRLKPVL